jgi:pyruvate,water dikinase
VDPLKLITVLQSYVANEIFTWQTSNRAAKERAEAESLIRTKLKGKPIRRRIFLHILKQARYFVSNRENLRYYRTRAFGMVRSMVLAFGQKLADIHCLDHPRDVFYLKLEELDQLATIPVPMQYIVAQRQDEYEQYATLPLPERIITNGRPGPLILMPDDAVATTTDNASLTGTPCSGGVVRGTVCKVSHASELASLNGGLLATYATDPGYVVLFPTASGILTERGSLLSHAAIVSREMGIPCIVGIEGLMSRIEDGDDLLMDGSTGVIRILNKA